MKKLIALVVIVLFAVALPVLAADTAKPEAKKNVVKGVISAIDEKADTFTVRDETGKDFNFVLSGKWKPNVKQGEMVAVHFEPQGDKKIVTSIVPAKHNQKGSTEVKSGEKTTAPPAEQKK